MRRVERWKAVNGVMGVKITPAQARVVFGGLDQFRRHYPDAGLISLIRENIVEQAVSMAMMKFRNFNHNSGAKDTSWKEEPFYDPEAIKLAVRQILRQENEADGLFGTEASQPLRLSQERMLASDRALLLSCVRRHLDLDGHGQFEAEAESRHQKLGTSINREYAARFEGDEAEFLREVADQRAARLAALAQVG